jgi:hypothetical protein
MSELQADKYIREQIRKILARPLVEAQSKVLGGGGKGGRYPKELMDLFGGETVGDLLSRKDPAVLMQRLGIGGAIGSNDYERILDLLKKGVRGREEMKAVYGDSFEAKEDGKGRQGVYLGVDGISMASGRFFLRELMIAANGAGLIELDGHVRVEIAENGVLIYPVKTETERWGN